MSYKDKHALAETLRKYKEHILGALFQEAADTIDELLDQIRWMREHCIERDNQGSGAETRKCEREDHNHG